MVSGDIHQNPWIVIPCNAQFAEMAPICEKNSRQKSENTTAYRSLVLGAKECPQGWTMVDSRCYILITYSFGATVSCTEAKASCTQLNGYLASNILLSKLVPLLKSWVKDEIGNYILFDYGLNCGLVKNKQVHHNASVDYWHIVQGTDHLHQSSPDSLGHSLCESNSEKRQVICSSGMTACSDGTCILTHHWCDGVRDCPLDYMDEQNCSHVCTGSQQCFSSCPIETCTCNSLYFQCVSGGCIPMSKICDGQSHCVYAEDEKYCQLDMNSNKNNGRNPVDNSRMPDTNTSKLAMNIPCSDPLAVSCNDHSGLCYHRSSHCTLDWDATGELSFCRSGVHLKWCASVQCPTLFKCPGSYCIPLRRICDGRIDCPHREDEKDCDVLSCPGMLRCRDDDLCLHPLEVCDGVVNCPLSGDDERHCPPFICPVGCVCHGWAIACHATNFLNQMENAAKVVHFTLDAKLISTNLDWLSPMWSLRNLFLVKSGIFALQNNVFITQTALIALDLSKNKITSIRYGYLEGLVSLQYLSLSENPIHRIEPQSFIASSRLKTLDISMMALANLEMSIFAGLHSLESLNLSSNWITNLNRETFIVLKSLKAFDLRKNPLIVVTEDMFLIFQRYNTPAIYFSLSYFCCKAPNWINCIAETIVDSKCADLLGEGMSLRIYLGIVSLILISMNGVAIIRNASYVTRTAQTTIIINQSVADLITGSWLLGTLIADHYYANIFHMAVYKWRTGLICNLCGTLTSTSLFLSTALYFLLTLDRYLYILNIVKLKKNHVKLSIMVMWVTVLFMNIFQTSYNELGNDLCLSLLSRRLPYNLAFLGLEVAMITYCIFASIQIVRYCIHTRISSGRAVSAQDKKMFMRLMVVPLFYSAFLMVKIFVGVTQLSKDFEYALLGVMGLLVPATNPVVFTLTTKSFLKFKKKAGSLKNKLHKWAVG